MVEPKIQNRTIGLVLAFVLRTHDTSPQRNQGLALAIFSVRRFHHRLTPYPVQTDPSFFSGSSSLPSLFPGPFLLLPFVCSPVVPGPHPLIVCFADLPTLVPFFYALIFNAFFSLSSSVPFLLIRLHPVTRCISPIPSISSTTHLINRRDGYPGALQISFFATQPEQLLLPQSLWREYLRSCRPPRWLIPPTGNPRNLGERRAGTVSAVWQPAQPLRRPQRLV